MATFEEQTADAIEACAKYLLEHKESLAEQFCAMPQKGWAIEFRAGVDGQFPWVEVNTSQRNADVVKAYDMTDSRPS